MNFKALFVGDSGVGKTVFRKYLQYGEFENNHVPTVGAEVYPYFIPSNSEGKQIKIVIWDIAGVGKLRGLADGYYVKANIAFLFRSSIDLEGSPEEIRKEKRERKMREKKWIDEVKRVCPGIPIVILASYDDLGNEQINNPHANVETKDGLGIPRNLIIWRHMIENSCKTLLQ